MKNKRYTTEDKIRSLRQVDSGKNVGDFDFGAGELALYGRRGTLFPNYTVEGKTEKLDYAVEGKIEILDYTVQ